MRALLWAALLALPLGLAAALPPAVAALLPQLAESERHLQDATLGLEAARGDAEPVQAEVAAARSKADGLLGRWRLRRHLAQLKARLDQVEAARVAQSAAREEVFAVLTGLEEELRGALEGAVAPGGKRPSATVLRAWWSQKLAWSRRLEALEAGADERGEAGGLERRRLLAEARAEQWERDLRLVDALERRAVLSAAEAAGERRQLQAAKRRGLKAAARP